MQFAQSLLGNNILTDSIIERVVSSCPPTKDWNQKKLFKEALEKNLERKPDLTFSQLYKIGCSLIKNEFPFWKVDTSLIPNYKDYRLPQNRMDMAVKNAITRMLAGDLDHWHSAHVAADYLNLTDEQKAWHAMFFGYSYRTQWATIAIQLFPDPASVDIQKLHEWSNSGNWARIPVGRDCRYQPRHFPTMVEGLQKLIGNSTLYDTLKASATVSDNPNENFLSLAKIISNCPRFGRMTTFLAMQNLYEFFDWPIDGSEMMMENPNTWSSRTGQIFLIDQDNLDEEEIIEKGKPAPSGDELKFLKESVAHSLNEINKHLPFMMDVFNFESEQCETYDKYMLKSREFNFWTSVELSELTSAVIDKWEDYIPTKDFPNVPDMRPLIIAQFVKRPYEMGGAWHDENWHKTAKHLGMCINYHYFLKEEPNLYDYLPIKKLGELRVQKIIDRWNTLFTKEEQENFRKKYDPRKYIRWKKSFNASGKYSKLLVDREVEFIESLDELEKNGELYHKRKDYFLHIV